ncbi:hypothetical protein Droror1_Dr00026597 [Drosera rotundifolia]
MPGEARIWERRRRPCSLPRLAKATNDQASFSAVADGFGDAPRHQAIGPLLGSPSLAQFEELPGMAQLDELPGTALVRRAPRHRSSSPACHARKRSNLAKETTSLLPAAVGEGDERTRRVLARRRMDLRMVRSGGGGGR